MADGPRSAVILPRATALRAKVARPTFALRSPCARKGVFEDRLHPLDLGFGEFGEEGQGDGSRGEVFGVGEVARLCVHEFADVRLEVDRHEVGVATDAVCLEVL